MNPFKIQNRTEISRRIKLVKNGGTIAFTSSPPTSFIENSRQAGFCLTAITPLPAMVETIDSIILTSLPMGVDGRISLYVNNALVKSVRYLNKNLISDRQTFFAAEFGNYATFTSSGDNWIFTPTASTDQFRLVFEDDDIDYLFNNFQQDPTSQNPTLIVQQYRLSFDLKKSFSISCDGATSTAPFEIFGSEFSVRVFIDGVMTYESPGPNVSNIIAHLIEHDLELNPNTWTLRNLSYNDYKRVTFQSVQEAEQIFYVMALSVADYSNPTVKVKIPNEDQTGQRELPYLDETLYSEVSFCLSPARITASYDGFYQTMTVIGEPGLTVETVDPQGNQIGTGVIGVGGSVTYPINEGMLFGGTPITTKGLSKVTNEATHPLVCSLFFEGKGQALYPEFGLIGNYFDFWETEFLPQGTTGEMIVETSKDATYVFDISNLNFTNQNDMWFDSIGYKQNGRSSDNPNGDNVTFKVRFRNLSRPIYLDIYNADYFYKFFDDGISNVGCSISPKTYDSVVHRPLKQIPTVLPASMVNLNFMFLGDEDFPVIADPQVVATLATWDTSNVTSTQGMFYGPVYDGELPINTLDWSSLTNPSYMFTENRLLNQTVNMSLPVATTTRNMFNTCYTLNSPVTLTNTNNVTSVEEMFYGCELLDSTVTMDTSNVTTFVSMFQGCSVFNKSVNHLDTGSGVNFTRMFAGCNAFNQTVSIDTSSATNLSYMFDNCWALNSPINIDTVNVTDMRYMFRSTTVFNQPLAHFKTSALTGPTSLSYFLDQNPVYNQDLSSWDMSSIPTYPTRFSKNGEYDGAQPTSFRPMYFWNQPIWGYEPSIGQADVSITIGGVTTTRVACKADNYIIPYRFEGMTADTVVVANHVVGLGDRAFSNLTVGNITFPAKDFVYSTNGGANLQLAAVITDALTIPEGQIHFPAGIRFSEITNPLTGTVVISGGDSPIYPGKLILPSTLTDVEITGFATNGTIGGIQEIICNAVTPPTVNLWSDDDCITKRMASSAVLKVPAGSVSAYQTAVGWGISRDGLEDFSFKIVAI